MLKTEVKQEENHAKRILGEVKESLRRIINLNKKKKKETIEFLQVLNELFFFDERVSTFVDSENKNPFLYKIIQELASKAGISPPLIFILKNNSGNKGLQIGMCSMRYKENLMLSMIGIDSNLLDIFNKEEITAIAAHEIGHIVTTNRTDYICDPLQIFFVFNNFFNSGTNFVDNKIYAAG